MNISKTSLNRYQASFLVLLRLFIGWHLLYEGVVKLLIPDWTSANYLLNSKWILAPFFHGMAENAGVLQVVDFLNIWGLILIGLFILLGLFTRYASLGGMILLGLYYLANPPFIGTDFGLPQEGQYLFINKTLIEVIALGVLLVFPSGKYFALDALFSSSGKVTRSEASANKETESGPASGSRPEAEPATIRRREILRYLAMVPVLGTFAWGTARKYRWNSVNAVSGATIQVGGKQLDELEQSIPSGKILDKSVSRLIAGGNLIGGWSHSRDLRYVSKLFKAYNTEMKVFETLALAEQCGINTINISDRQLPLLNKYKRLYDSDLQTMAQVHPKKEDRYGVVDKAIENGANLIQIQGNCCDWRVRDGEIDVIADCLDYIRKQGYPAGLGAHSVQALMACDAEGIEPDFFMKTFHHDKYWSAHPRENRIPFSVDGERSLNHDEFHDNMFCLFADETREFMQQKSIPWVAFKILAGGAIKPQDGFRFAFEGGADFICVGMFDWQIVEDVNLANQVLADLGTRQRSWYG